MAYYVLYNKELGNALAGIYDDEHLPPSGDNDKYGVKAFFEPLPDLSTHIWHPATLSFIPRQKARRLDRIDFLRRFTIQERIATIRATKTDDVVNDFFTMLTIVGSVELDHQDTVSGLAYLESVGLLAAGRANQIRDV